jgi:predicted RNase H-like nuclease (RuvC/YqgF family)
MNCDNLNKWILLSIGLVAIGDVLAFFIELTNQRCEKQDEAERKKSDENISRELKELRESSNRLTTESKELRRELVEIRKMLA